jgi:hypothetical protein
MQSAGMKVLRVWLDGEVKLSVIGGSREWISYE